MLTVHQSREIAVAAESIHYEGDNQTEDRWARFRPPEDGWTAQDLDRIPDLPPHTELIDGILYLPFRLGEGDEDDPWALARPPEGGWTAAEMDRIPDLPPHTELIDGSLVFVSPQKVFHLLVLDILAIHLRQFAPAGFRVRREQAILLGEHRRPEPDLFVIRQDGTPDLDQTTFLPAQVKLVIEVESPESEARDRNTKPLLYADAGIAHFWRVENQSGVAVVFAYELDAKAKAYRLTGEHRGQFKVAEPFPIEVDLTEIHRL